MLWETSNMVSLTKPYATLSLVTVELTPSGWIRYIPGYLAFREVEHLVALTEKLKREKPELWPQVVSRLIL